MQFVRQEMGAISPSRHPCEIKAAQGIEHWQYCRLFTEPVKNCQTVDADEGRLRNAVDLIQRTPERFCQMKTHPTISLRAQMISRRPSLTSIYFIYRNLHSQLTGGWLSTEAGVLGFQLLNIWQVTRDQWLSVPHIIRLTSGDASNQEPEMNGERNSPPGSLWKTSGAEWKWWSCDFTLIFIQISVPSDTRLAC